MDNLRRLPVEPLDPAEENQITALLLEVIRWLADGGPLDHIEALTGSLRSSTLRLAKLHGLAPALYAALRHTDPAAAEQFPALRRAYLVQAAHAALGMEQLRAILEATSSSGVRCMPWKGSDTSFTLYRDPALRALSDIDILVEEQNVERTVSLLTRLGYAKVETAMSREEEWINVTYLGGLCMLRNRDLPIEIHSNFLRGFGRRNAAVADAWQAVAPTTLEGCEALTLPPEMGFIISAIHLLSNHGRSIPYLKDAADLLLFCRRIAATGDWLHMWGLCERWGVLQEVRRVAAFLNRFLDGRVAACEGADPAFAPEDIVFARDRLHGRGRLTEALGLRIRMSRHLPNAWARLRFFAALVVPRPGFLRWRYRVAPGRPVWPYYLRHLRRAAIRLPYDALVRTIRGRRSN